MRGRCRDAETGITEQPPDPAHPPAPAHPPGTCRPLERGQNSTRCTSRRILRMLRAPRGRGPQAPGGMAAAPASPPGGSRGGGPAGVPRALATRSLRRSARPGPAGLSAAPPGSARRGGGGASAPPQLGEEGGGRPVRPHRISPHPTRPGGKTHPGVPPPGSSYGPGVPGWRFMEMLIPPSAHSSSGFI